MTIRDLDLFHSEFTDLFDIQTLPATWRDDLIILPAGNVEAVSQTNSFNEEGWKRKPPHWTSPSEELDDFAEREIRRIVASGKPGAVPSLNPSIVGGLGEPYGGSPTVYSDDTPVPPADCLAFYLPFHHFYPDSWGVYLIFEGMIWLAAEILRRTPYPLPPRSALDASRLFLYYHEVFHHKTECFAARLELTHRASLYKKGFLKYYRQTLGSNACLEEGLANAEALEKSSKRQHYSGICHALSSVVQDSPPGYSQGNFFCSQFAEIRNQFAEDNQRICLPHIPSKNPNIWGTVQHLFDPIVNLKRRVRYVMPRGSAIAAGYPFHRFHQHLTVAEEELV